MQHIVTTALLLPQIVACCFLIHVSQRNRGEDKGSRFISLGATLYLLLTLLSPFTAMVVPAIFELGKYSFLIFQSLLNLSYAAAIGLIAFGISANQSNSDCGQQR